MIARFVLTTLALAAVLTLIAATVLRTIGATS